jgi:hypothetical protein
MQLLAYIGEFSGDFCISPEFLSEILYIFSVELFAMLYCSLSWWQLKATQHQYWRLIVYFLLILLAEAIHFHIVDHIYSC